jgi:hypothetical protein
MNRNWKCPERWVLGGRHASHCQSKGCQSVGPHPDAPPPSESSVRVAPSQLPQCPYGIARLDCDYHKTPQAPASEQGPYDYATPDAWIDIPGCNCGRCR